MIVARGLGKPRQGSLIALGLTKFEADTPVVEIPTVVPGYGGGNASRPYTNAEFDAVTERMESLSIETASEAKAAAQQVKTPARVHTAMVIGPVARDFDLSLPELMADTAAAIREAGRNARSLIEHAQEVATDKARSRMLLAIALYEADED